MHTLEIPDRNKIIEIPSHWDECTEDEAKFILRLSFSLLAKKIDLVEYYVRVFCYLTGLEPSSYYYYKTQLNDAEDINSKLFILAEKLCSWPFKDSDNGLEFNFNSVRNFFYKIEIQGVSLIGPNDLISNLSLSQFRMAIREMNEYIRSMKESEDIEVAHSYLDKFISILYQKEGEKFDTEDPFRNIEIINTIPMWMKQSILMFFTSCLKYIQTEDVLIDGNVINLSPLFPKSSSDSNKGIGWAGILFDIASDGLFGDVSSTDSTGIFDIFTYLYKKHQDNKELEKKYKSKKR